MPQGWTPVQDKPAGWTAVEEPKAQPRSWLDSVGDFAKGAWGNLVQSGAGMVEAAKHPIEAVKNIGAAQDEVRLRAEKAFKEGNYAEGVRHVLGYLLPVVGPQIDVMGNKAQAGHVAEALGEATATAAQLAGPNLLQRASVPLLPAIRNPNPAEAAATGYLQSEGVPVSAAASTGNPYIRNIQKVTDATPVGAMVAQRAERASTEAVQGLSERLANRASPAPVVPEQAGAAVRGALTSRGANFAADAEAAYQTFRGIEADPANLRTVQTGTKQVNTGVVGPDGQPIMRTVPVTEDIPLATDMRGIKQTLKPMLDDMDKWMEPAKRNASQGYQAARSLVNGPDFIPASQAEVGLGGLKQLAREGAGRNQGMAKFIVPKLQAEIDKVVASANDPRGLAALHSGRAATAAQHGTQGVLEQLRTEPVQTFAQLTWQKDAGIDMLRQVQREVPGEMARVGRAYLEDLFTKAQSEGGWGHAAGLYAKWRDLGPQTKQVLFQNPALISDLDKFFLGVKKLAENPNPSGTAIVGFSGSSGALIVMHPQTGIPLAIGAGALSKMLHSPAGVRALNNGLRLPLKSAGGAAAVAQILKMAGQEAQPVALPAAASDQTPQIAPLATMLP